MRECGDCTACCELLHVEELAKPADVRCEHLAEGGGCGIYADRFPICRGFRCLWLQGRLPEEARPDKVGAIAFVRINHDDVAVQAKSVGEAHRLVRIVRAAGYRGPIDARFRSDPTR